MSLSNRFISLINGLQHMGWIPESYATYLRNPKDGVSDFSEKAIEGSIIEAFWDNAGPGIRKTLIQRMLYSNEYAELQQSQRLTITHGDRNLLTLNVVQVTDQSGNLSGLNRRDILNGRLKALHEQYGTQHPIDRESWTSEKRREFNLLCYAAKTVYMSGCTEEEAMQESIKHMNWVDSIGKEPELKS